MTKRKTTLGVALAGAVVLAGGAYALGAQQDDGTALAGGKARGAGAGWGAGPGGPGGPGGPPGLRRGFMREGFEDFASRLGVSETKLREALRNIRPDRDDFEAKRAERVKKLAAALGVPETKVEAAIEKYGPGPGRRFRGGPGGPGGPPPGGKPPRRAERLDDFAKALGVTPAKLRAAMQQLGEEKRDEFAQKLATELGISVDKVKDALPEPPKRP
jgi:transcriptional regulator with XRE-family HTH domain